MSDQDANDESLQGSNPVEFGRPTRRTFLSRLGTAGLLATAGPVTTAFGQHFVKDQAPSLDSKDAIPVTLRVNGKKHDLRIVPERRVRFRPFCKERIVGAMIVLCHGTQVTGSALQYG